MKLNAARLYASLQQDMHVCCEGLSCADSKKLEECFQLAVKYAAKAEEVFLESDKPDQLDDAARIHYYKYWKPRFASESAYYSLRFYLQVYEESKPGSTELKRFREREQRRLDKFIVDNTEFYKSYVSGYSSLDAEWFLDDEERCKVYVNLISTLLSLERYSKFLQT